MNINKCNALRCQVEALESLPNWLHMYILNAKFNTCRNIFCRDDVCDFYTRVSVWFWSQTDYQECVTRMLKFGIVVADGSGNSKLVCLQSFSHFIHISKYILCTVHWNIGEWIEDGEQRILWINAKITRSSCHFCFYVFPLTRTYTHIEREATNIHMLWNRVTFFNRIQWHFTLEANFMLRTAYYHPQHQQQQQQEEQRQQTFK